VAGEAPGRAFAATWRDERGEVVGTTWGGTMCLWPLKPWRIRIARDGFEHVIRCGECPGCMEFDRRRLADRLWRKYGSGNARGAATTTSPGGQPADGVRRQPSILYIVRIYAPIDLHARIAHALHRRRGLRLEPGMWRLGSGSFAVISREKAAVRECLDRLGLRHRIEPLRLSRGRRAFRVLTAGLLVAREIYGEQRNRWYARGLPPAEREKWEVQKLAKYQSYDRARSPRARTERRVVLVPPDVWQLSRTDRRALRGLLVRQPDPEGVRKVMGIVADTIRAASSGFHVSAPPKAVLTREQVARWYARNAEASKARTIVTASDPNLPPLSEAGGYVSSEHSQGELMPRELERQRRKEWLDAKAERAKRESMEIIERMKKKARERGNPDA
jgi:hypothetical protein